MEKKTKKTKPKKKNKLPPFRDYMILGRKVGGVEREPTFSPATQNAPCPICETTGGEKGKRAGEKKTPRGPTFRQGPKTHKGQFKKHHLGRINFWPNGNGTKGGSQASQNGGDGTLGKIFHPEDPQANAEAHGGGGTKGVERVGEECMKIFGGQQKFCFLVFTVGLISFFSRGIWGPKTVPGRGKGTNTIGGK